jgi:hypothetical protein
MLTDHPMERLVLGPLLLGGRSRREVDFVCGRITVVHNAAGGLGRAVALERLELA